MATNKASQELQSLLNMENAAQSNIRNSQQLLDERSDFVARPGGEAGFAMPEALATAVAASFVLGPGGILLGIAQGLLGKKEKQNELDKFAAAQGAYSSANQVIFDDLDQRMLTHPQNAEQYNDIRTRLDMADQYARSGDPILLEQAMAMQEQISSDYSAIQTTDEAQGIAQDVREAQIARELTKDQQATHKGLLTAYDAQSSEFKTVMQKSNSGRAMLARGNPADLVAALIQINKALDPISVVRPEEAKAFGNVGTALEQAQTKLGEWAATGQSMSPQQREEISALFDTIDQFAIGQQNILDMTFQERAIDFELPDKFVNDFRYAEAYPRIEAGPMQERAALGDATSDALSMKIGDIADALIGLPDMMGEDTRTAEEKQADLDKYGRLGRD